MSLRFEQIDQQYWHGWLPKGFDKGIVKIRKSVKKIYKEYEQKGILPHYTPHGISHLQAVEDNLHLLLPGKTHESFTYGEKFFLLGSAWLHDLGMLKGIFNNDPETISIKDIRDRHHIRSEKFIIEYWQRCGLKEFEASTFALLARFHRRRVPISECKETIEIVKYGTIRIKLLASYLRLADALHIDITRAPATAYAICLSYDIPDSSKQHWIKSKFVLGIDVDTKQHNITIHLRNPIMKDDEFIKNREQRLESTYSLIVNDIEEELDSVKEVLINAGITYFLQVKRMEHRMEIDTQLNIDIKGLLNNYDILAHPSSTALLNLALNTMEDILSSNKKTAKAVKMKNLNNFLKELEENVLRNRKCHLGLRNLVEQYSKCEYKEKDIENIIKEIKEKKEFISKNRIKIRYNAKRYFKDHILFDSKKKNEAKLKKEWRNLYEYLFPEKKEKTFNNEKELGLNTVNILLYGYSTLVLNALCGFRDAVIELLIDKYNSVAKEGKFSVRSVHQIEFEKSAAKLFRIFVCEAQPKTQTGWNGTINFHDGSQYAIYLGERNFTNIHIIPDAIVGTLLQKIEGDTVTVQDKNANNVRHPHIHFVIVGANGFDKDYFRHSAGHATIAKLAKMVTGDIIERENNTFFPKVILATTTSKFYNEENDDDSGNNNENEFEKIDGWLFKSSFENEPTRNKVFVTQDIDLKKSLAKYGISFYNPREDKIKINKYLDAVICEKDYKTNPKSGKEIKNMKDYFADK